MPTNVFSRGHGKKPKGSPTPPSPPSRQSGGTSGNLTVKHHKTKTPVVVVPAEPKKAKPESKAKPKPPGAYLKLPPAYRPENDPHATAAAAKAGIAPPPESLKKYAPKAYEKQKLDYIARHEGIHADPVAEFLISTAATGGLGLGAKAIGSAGEAGLARLASTEATVGEAAGEKALKAAVTKAASGESKGARVVAKVKAAPKEAVERAKRYPGKKARQAKAAPKSARRAVTTSEGRKAAARSAARHPVRTGYGAAVASPVPLPGEIDKRARAAAEGTVNAIVHHPGETAKTTARALPGAIVAPVAIGAAVAESALHGTTKPLKETAREQLHGVGQIAANTFSGDPEKAEEAARKEGSLAFLTPLPALSRLRPVKALEEDARGGAAKVRAVIAAKGESANRSVRHAPEGVEQHVFGFSGRRDARKRTALIKQRADNPARVSASHHERQVTKHIAKAPKGSEVALQTLAEYGIRDAKGAQLVRERGPGDAQLKRALDYADEHPHVFSDKHFKRALEAVARASETAPAALVGKGERARLLQQGDVLGTRRPEHRLPEKAVGLTHASDREGAWKDLQTSEGRLRELRRQGRAKLEQAKVTKEAESAQLKTEAKALYAEARKIQKRNSELFKALDPYTRPGQSIDRSQRRPYDSKMLAGYKAEVEAGRKSAGLGSAIFTHHNPASGDKGAGIENRFPASAGRVEHMREGNLAKADNLDRSLQGLIQGTIHMPRMRAAGKQFGRDFVREFQTPFTIDGKQKTVGQGSADWTAITRPKSKDNPNGGQFDPKSWARFPLREWKNAVKDPFTTDTELNALLQKAEEGQVKGNEPWVLMPREAIKEARAQINPEHNIVTEGMNKFSRVANRAILGTNPAWAVAQVVAEGVPLLMAKPSLLNPAKVASIERDIVRFRKEHPEEALALQATAGASPVGGAALRTPLDMQETYTPALWEKGARGLTRGKAARSVLSLAKLRALGEFDVRRQNEYRTLLAAAEADRKFRSWHSSLTGLFDRQAHLSKRFKTRDELWSWLATDPKGKAELKKITDYVDNIQGNWTAFTRYERAAAPFTIFYPFLRYSLRWTLWSFPKTHPVRATIAYMLGQANANQLEKLAGGPLPNPIGYAYPAFQDAKGETDVLPGGSRISPGQSSLTEALMTGNPAAVLSSANPFLGAGITATTGVEPFTGQESSLPRGEAAINSLLSMPAPARIGRVKFGGQSVASKAFEQYDPLKTARSFLFPFLPQHGKQFAGAEKLGKAFSEKYANPVPSLPAEVWEAAYNKDWKLAKKLRDKRLKAEKAGDKVKAAEEPFFPPGNDELGDEGSKILQYITGQIVLPAEEEGEEEAGSSAGGWRSSASASSGGWRSSKSSSGGWR
jgi:hypothetical protein